MLKRDFLKQWAAAIRDFRSQEFASGRRSPDDWGKVVTCDGPVIENGKYRLSNRPGLGVELNEDFVRNHLMSGEIWRG